MKSDKTTPTQPKFQKTFGTKKKVKKSNEKLESLPEEDLENLESSQLFDQLRNLVDPFKVRNSLYYIKSLIPKNIIFKDGLLKEESEEMTKANTSDKKKSKEEKIRHCLKVIFR